jgi:hypothetical protein
MSILVMICWSALGGLPDLRCCRRCASNCSSSSESESYVMTSPLQCTPVYTVSIVAVNGRNLEILMAAPYLFGAVPVMESSNN